MQAGTHVRGAEGPSDRHHGGDAGHLVPKGGLEREAHGGGLAGASHARAEEHEPHGAVVVDVHELDVAAVGHEGGPEPIERSLDAVAERSGERGTHASLFGRAHRGVEPALGPASGQLAATGPRG